MKNNKVKILLYALVGQLFPFSSFLCAHGNFHDNGEREKVEGHWTQEKSAFAEIVVKVAGPGIIQNFTQASGKISVHPDYLAYVIPKVSGSVCEIKKNIGDSVEKDEVIAVIESKEITEAKANYLAALKKNTMHQAVLKKEESVRGISALQDYLNAKLAAEEASIQLKVTTQSLYALGFTEQEISKIEQERAQDLRFYKVKSPINGKILERNLTLGEVSDPASKVFTVANFERVWIEMNVSPADVVYLKEGVPVNVIAANGKEESVQICQYNPTISEETRMAKAIASVENSLSKWTPGEYVTINIQTHKTEAPIVIPREAIQNFKGTQVVFIEREAEFTPSIVQLGKMDGQNVEILSGLKAGESYAACNTFCIKADFEKEEVEHPH